MRGERGWRALDGILIPRVSDTVVWVELDGEVVIYDEANGSMHLLSNAAAAVWVRCDGSQAVDQIIGELADEYRADEAQIARDVTELMSQLTSKGLLEGVSSVDGCDRE
jgi:PqqD family protein of HPr-rel-A system